MIGVLVLVLGLVGGLGSASADEATSGETVTIQVRVWQYVDDPSWIFILAAPPGDDWGTSEIVQLVLDDGLSTGETFRYDDLTVGVVELRLWQQVADPLRIRISARPVGGDWGVGRGERLLLDDGHSPDGTYRYGDITLAVSVDTPDDTPVDTADDTPVAAAADPPAVVVSPAGEDVPRLAALTIAFRDPPSEANGAAIVAIDPSLEGVYVWLDDRTLLFQPAFPGWRRAEQYRVTVDAVAAGLDADHLHSFSVEGGLEVSYVIPGDGDVEAPRNAQILVQFNRSVAPLTVLQEESAASLLEFDPPLAGRGEWLNTSLYRFIPTALERHTEYSVRIAAGLSSASDGVLASDFTWSFTTIQPAITEITPHSGANKVELDSSIVVSFNQPMDRVAVRTGLVLRTEAQEPVPGRFKWSDDSTSVSFTPAEPLTLGAGYEVFAPAGMRGANGGATRFRRTSNFRAIRAPRLESTWPSDGETDAYWYGLGLYYNNPMDIESFEGRVSISGIDPENLRLDSYTEQGDTSISFGVEFEGSTTYTVRLAEGIRDLGGRPLPAHEFSFTTRENLPWPYLSLSAPASLSTFSSSRNQVLHFHATRVAAVHFQLYRLSDAEAEPVLRRGFIETGWPGYSGYVSFSPQAEPLRRWTKQIDEKLRDAARLYSTTLGRSRPLPKGHYLLLATPESILGSTETNYQKKLFLSVVDTAIVTKLAHDELLVWALDYDTGAPLDAEPVRVAQMERAPLSPYHAATTDTDGVARFAVSAESTSWRSPYGDYLVRIDDGGRHGVASTWWNYGAGFTSSYAPGPAGHLFTDRPIYRPGETVFYRGILRDENDASYSVPGGDAKYTVTVRDPRYADILVSPVELSELGTFSGEIVLGAAAHTGSYQITVSDDNGDRVTSTHFSVVEFRVPEFEVAVEAAGTDYVAGETIPSEARATYFFGGPVADAAVTWTQLSWPTILRVEGYEGYSFWEGNSFWRNLTRPSSLRSSGEATADASGVARFDVAAELDDGDGTQQFTINATVTDASAQAIAGSTTVSVHPAAWYAGIRPASYVARAGEAAIVQLVSVDFRGQIAPNRPLTVRMFKREWIRTNKSVWSDGAYYRSEPHDTEVDVQSVTTNEQGEASIEFVPPSAGAYRLVAESTDEAGRVARSDRFLWATGKGYASWPVRDDDVIELIADRERYEVGDIAEVLVPAPYAGATGLITMERGVVLSTAVRHFETNSEVLRVPIEDHYIPSIYVRVVLYRPPTEADPYPRYHVGHVRLSVSPAPRRLNVSIEADRAKAQPGEIVHHDLLVTDAEGRGVEAEIAVAVVDKAVLSLLDEVGVDGMSAFWSERALAVRTASSLSVSIDHRNKAYRESLEGERGSGNRDAENASALEYEEAHEEEEEYAASGGGGDSGALPDAARLRSDFRNTALWIGQLKTNEDGRASFELQLPDNATTWRTRARAVTAQTQLGEGESELLVTKPLLVRPALPRFLRVGDELTLRALVQNRKPEAVDVTLSIDTEGLAVEGGDARTVRVEPGSSAVFGWPARAVEEGTATVRFSATVPDGDGDGDAVELSIPVHPDVTPETTATGGVVEDAPVVEALYLPDYALTEQGSLEVSLQASLVGALDAELRHFRPLEWESNVRVASRIVATVALSNSNASGLTEAQHLQLNADIERLIGQHRYDGGWAWCRPCGVTNLWVTAWALIALGEASDAGFDVPEYQYSRTVEFVTNHVNRETEASSPPDPNQHAFLLYALANAANQDDEDSAVADELGSAMRQIAEEHRHDLASWARAYLLLGLFASGHDADHESVRTLLNDLVATTIPSANGNHWEDERHPGSMHNGSVRATALVLRALVEVDPGHPLIEETARWLVLARAQDRWKTSVERAQGMASLGAFAALTGENRGVYDYQVLLGSRRLLDGHFDVPAGDLHDGAVVALDELPLGEVNRVQFKRDAGRAGRMYYALNLRYVTPAEDLDALNRGFAVSRRYSLLAAPDRAVTGASLGEVVRVELTVVASADRLFARVEDFLPAGLEPIDQKLNIVSPWLREQLRAERVNALRATAPAYYAPWFAWYFSPWDQVDIRDDRVTLLAGRLLRGVHRYVYYARATTPGDFFVPPAHAEETYFPEVFGRGDSSRFTVRPAE